jgi:hypothetical protein
MSDFTSAAIATETLCFTLIRFPLACGAGLCTFAFGIWLRAKTQEDYAQLIRNTTIQSLPEAVDNLRSQAIESEGAISSVFVVTRGLVVPAEPSIIILDSPSGGSAVLLHSRSSTTPLAGGYLGLFDNESTVRAQHQLVIRQ